MLNLQGPLNCEVISGSSESIEISGLIHDWQVIATPPTNQRPACGHPQTSGHHREVEPDIFPNRNPTGKMKAGQHKNPAYNPSFSSNASRNPNSNAKTP